MRSAIAILKADSTLTTALGGAAKVRANVASQGNQTPFVIVDVEDSQSNYTFDTRADIDHTRLVVMTVADRTFTDSAGDGATDLAKLVRDALENASPGTYAGEEFIRCDRTRHQVQEDRLADKPQITVEEEYLLVVRP